MHFYAVLGRQLWFNSHKSYENVKQAKHTVLLNKLSFAYE